MNQYKYILVAVVFLGFFLLQSTRNNRQIESATYPQTSESAKSIIDKVDKNMSTKTQIVTSDMIIYGKRNDRIISSKGYSEGTNKSFTEYLSPAREKGTKMLKLEDRLWIYSPSTDRTIQLSGHMLRQSVMGSDLSYEDMMEDRKLLDTYDAKIIGTEQIDGRKTWQLELIAKVEDVAYYKRMLWVDQERYAPLKEELFAKSGQLLKKITFSNLEKIDGRWYPKNMNYKDMLKAGKGTDFMVKEIQFNPTIPEHIFTKGSLKKINFPYSFYMRCFLCFLIFQTLGINFLNAQEPYAFQQQVHYQINVTLNDSLQQLNGHVSISYTNRSPDTLKEIYLHLWPNAYQDRNTAFAQQQLQHGSTTFHFSKEEDRGFIDSLDFRIEEQVVSWGYWQGLSDVAVLTLAQSLLPNMTIQIATPFRVKVPASFSRLGHVETSYQITQWYPKPAVYDQDGWHPMPYLDIGEFYSEFASFEVAITLPKNYVVAATGTLESSKEVSFLEEKVEETEAYLTSRDTSNYVFDDPFPTSAKTVKTLHYLADQVHDFAWFADKRFLVLKDNLFLKSGQKVECWAFFTKTEAELWTAVPAYLKRSLQFYSDALGSYPYPQMTAVQSALSAGAGMEYPMITVIGESYTAEALDEVIAHEVGHNWLYGILAFNERDNAWMDEGLNTFLEQKYMQRYYGKQPNEAHFPSYLQGDSKYPATATVYHYLNRQNLNQKVATFSNDLSETNYWFNAYDLPAFAFRHLEAYLGEQQLADCLQGFYQKWQFQHPGPNDLKRQLQTCSEKNLDWFFETYINNKPQVNYGIRKAQLRQNKLAIQLNQTGKQAPPIRLQILDSTKSTGFWVPGFLGDTTFQLAIPSFSEIHLDPYHQVLETRKKDNHYYRNKRFPKIEKWHLQLLPQLENDEQTTITLLPTLLYNHYDGISNGLTLTNVSLLPHNFEYWISPLYSWRTQKWVGTSGFRYVYYPNTDLLESLRLELRYRKFHYMEVPATLAYQQYRPQLTWVWKKSLPSTLEHRLSLSANYVNQDQLKVASAEGYRPNLYHRIRNHQLAYQVADEYVLFPQKWTLALHHEQLSQMGEKQDFLKLSSDWQGRLLYQEDRTIFLRAYLGCLVAGPKGLHTTSLTNAFTAQAAGWNDYAYANSYLGRNEITGIAAQQIHTTAGAFKLPLVPFSNLGRSNHFIAALNFKMDLPFAIKLPVRPYFDLVYLAPPSRQQEKLPSLIYGGGLALDLWHERLAVYFPIYTSRSLIDSIQSLDLVQKKRNYAQQISFVFQLDRLTRKDLAGW